MVDIKLDGIVARFPALGISLKSNLMWFLSRMLLAHVDAN